MSAPTDRDRATAFYCWADSDPVETIAAAIAAERERVLAPVRALAEELEGHRWQGLRDVGARLRAVLPPTDTEETPDAH